MPAHFQQFARPPRMLRCMRFASRVSCFQGVPDKKNGGIKKRRFYEEPAAERCTSDLGVCTEEGAGKAAYSK